MSDDGDPEIHIASLEELTAILTGVQGVQRDRAQMTSDQLTMRLVHFIESLTVDQLMTLRCILGMKSRKVHAFIDGMVFQQLLVVHHVDAKSGEPLLAH